MVPETEGNGSQGGQAMRLPRFRVPTVLIGVALVAIGLDGMEVWRRTSSYRRKAVEHAHAARQARLQALFSLPERFLPRMTFRNISPITREWLIQSATYHESLAAKYERAAQYPWLPVEPDLPEPK